MLSIYFAPTSMPPLLVTYQGGWGPSVVGWVIISVFLGIPGVIGWLGTAERGSERIFRSGPALLVPGVCLWTLLSHYTCRHEVECSDDLWRILPFYGGIAVAAIWHVALLIDGKGRSLLHWLYAIGFFPGFYLYSMMAMALAIKFPL
jgi:hypothetical protein